MRRSSSDQPPLGAGRLDNIAIGSENLNAGNGGEVAVIGNDLDHAMASHGFEDEEVIAVDLFNLQPVQSGRGCG